MHRNLELKKVFQNNEIIIFLFHVIIIIIIIKNIYVFQLILLENKMVLILKK